MSRVKVAQAADIGDGERLIKEVNGREIGIFNIGGEYHALPNRCPHQGGPLCEGPVANRLNDDATNGEGLQWEKTDEILYCPWHQCTFHIPTGRSYGYPADSPTYEVYAEDGDLFLEL